MSDTDNLTIRSIEQNNGCMVKAYINETGFRYFRQFYNSKRQVTDAMNRLRKRGMPTGKEVYRGYYGN